MKKTQLLSALVLTTLCVLVGGDSAAGGPEDILYIDADFACGGDGSSASPFCSLQEAFDSPSLAPGLHLRVRDASQAYEGAVATPGESGAEGSPIVLEPDVGHDPTIGGQVELDGAAYWRIRGLRFEPVAGGGPHAVFARARSGAILRGVEITGNRIVGWGGANPLIDASAIRLSSPTDGADVLDATVERNTIEHARSQGIAVSGASGVLIAGNTVRRLRCGADYRAIFVERSPNARVTGNQVLDFDFEECPSEGDTPRIMAILLLGQDGGRVDHNLVRGVARAEGQGAAGDSVQGIGLVNGCQDIDVDHNIVVDTEDCALCVGIDYSNSGSRIRFVANTLVPGGDVGLELDDLATEITLENNIMARATETLVRVRSADQLSSVDNNLYANDDPERVGQCGGGAQVRDLAGWQNACGVDAASLFGDPMIPALSAASDNFTPASASLPVDLGAVVGGLVVDFHGRAPDAGALEAPLPVAAEVEAATPARIRLELQQGAGGELLYDEGCTGFSATADGAPLEMSSCSRAASDLIEFDLVGPVYANQAVTLAYNGTHITDTAAVGGIIGAQLQPFNLDVDNGSTEPEPASDTGSSTSGDAPGSSSGDDSETTPPTSDGPMSTTTNGGSTEGATTNAATDSETDATGGATESDGCGCRSPKQRSPGWAALFGLAFLLGCRRRAA